MSGLCSDQLTLPAWSIPWLFSSAHWHRWVYRHTIEQVTTWSTWAHTCTMLKTSPHWAGAQCTFWRASLGPCQSFVMDRFWHISECTCSRWSPWFVLVLASSRYTRTFLPSESRPTDSWQSYGGHRSLLCSSPPLRAKCMPRRNIKVSLSLSGESSPKMPNTHILSSSEYDKGVDAFTSFPTRAAQRFFMTLSSVNFSLTNSGSSTTFQKSPFFSR